MIGGGVDDTTPEAKDQGHKRKCSQKKKEKNKRLQKFFSGYLQKKGLQIFFQAISK